jgi:hypothetical protein
MVKNKSWFSTNEFLRLKKAYLFKLYQLTEEDLLEAAKNVFTPRHNEIAYVAWLRLKLLNESHQKLEDYAPGYGVTFKIPVHEITEDSEPYEIFFHEESLGVINGYRKVIRWLYENRDYFSSIREREKLTLIFSPTTTTLSKSPCLRV